MCPFCLAGFALVATSVASGSGLAALSVNKIRKTKRTNPHKGVTDETGRNEKRPRSRIAG